MIDEIQLLLDSHWKWLRDKTAVKNIGDDWIEITTPYLDRHNDMLQIYAKQDKSGFILTDDGYIISDLLHSGCPVDSPKRQKLLSMTLAGFGIENHDGSLQTHATKENFAFRKHSLIQAMLSVNDLFFLAEPASSSVFIEDVQAWLDLNDVRYTSRVKLTGKSGFDHLFEFVIPRSKKYPERLLETLNYPTKTSAMTFVMNWMDTQDARSPGSRAYAILNDQNHAISPDVFDALRSYEIHPVEWSKRELGLEELAA
jgi:hypothetical protein